MCFAVCRVFARPTVAGGAIGMGNEIPNLVEQLDCKVAGVLSNDCAAICQQHCMARR